MFKKRAVLFLLITLSLFTKASAQLIRIKQPVRDKTYIKTFYKKHLIIRAYESTKFNNFKYSDHESKLVFKPNKHNNFGLGLNYKFISLNFAFYIPGLGRDVDIYGKTRQLDLQTHFFMHKVIVDFYGQFYKGYYLSNTDAIINDAHDEVLNRPDMKTRNISLVCQYLFNDQKFSYNAPFYQNELQKKSAGSFLVGGGIYHTALSADSSVIPPNSQYTEFYNNYEFNTSCNYAVGVMGGYAYTFVIKKHFFLTGYLSAGGGVNYATLNNTLISEKRDRVGPQLNVTERLAAGYNGDKFFAGVTYIRLFTRSNATQPNCWQDVNSGNFRVVAAMRFKVRKTLIPKNDLLDAE